MSFDARSIHGDHEDTGVAFVLHRDQPVVRHEGGMRQCRAGGDDLGPADRDSPVVLPHRRHAYVSALVNGAVPINRRVNDGMIEIQRPLLCLLVPCPGVVLVWRVKSRRSPQSAEKRALVIRRSSKPAIGQADPAAMASRPASCSSQVIGARK